MESIVPKKCKTTEKAANEGNESKVLLGATEDPNASQGNISM